MTVDINYPIEEWLGKEVRFWRQLIDSSIRILGITKRYEGRSRKYEIVNAPRDLKKYWKAVAKLHKLSEKEIENRMERIFEGLTGVNGYLIKPNELYFILPNEKVFVCSKCNRIHLHPSNHVCTDCYSRLEEQEMIEYTEYDYYRYLAEDKKSERRFHCEEMTGQTDSEEASRRQQLFQGIFNNEDIPIVEEIDILSVTTTMEAGVDIGSLRLVAMSNMPPQRFNYQQRVGRCGRRGTALSVSLTLCRGRSHDDWYFDNLDKMTGDPPPQPYIDLKSEKIFKRVLVKEVLFYAFKSTGLTEQQIKGESVHGNFGLKLEWGEYKDTIERYLSSREGVQQTNNVIQTLKYGTKLSEQELSRIKEYVVNGQLIKDITEIASDARYSQNVLSENLATAGLLPMFGFPTRVRLLHHGFRTENTKPHALDKDTVDRDLEIAINEYSPGSELVKDKSIHKSVGIAHYWVSGNRVIAERNPLGKVREVAYCKNCYILYDQESVLPDCCDSCGEPLSNQSNCTFRKIPISEPQGFRTDWIKRDFRESFEWVSRSTVAKLAQDYKSLPNKEFRGNTEYWLQEGNVYLINDNNGSNFKFIKARNDFMVGLKRVK
ncbi:hypothetical protein H1D32_24150 [Anaerobacillus sp. CMMVII]|uniref:helicase C-terminal domain-containing protein n=1 Tax=Anaerobacillus sp. CMMVII TaxID=2755588 RepID=UPI0021B84846|nr:helicase C-terminal domain-containing protein [Anaerobacillus sp. CMMVII]MCT8140493.1 hypothetical protein [Anaerobacillus sp. CMMVII]